MSVNDKLDNDPFEDACEEDREPSEDEELMDKVEADNNFS